MIQVAIMGYGVVGSGVAEILLTHRESLKKRAQEEAELEKKHAMDDVKQEMIQIASLMASKVVAASINTQIQDTLVEETLKEIGESTWQS